MSERHCVQYKYIITYLIQYKNNVFSQLNKQKSLRRIAEGFILCSQQGMILWPPDYESGVID